MLRSTALAATLLSVGCRAAPLPDRSADADLRRHLQNQTLFGGNVYVINPELPEPEAQQGGPQAVPNSSAIVLTAIATEAVPLYVVPVLPADVLLKMDSISMTVKDSIYKGTGQIVANSNFTFKISSFSQINSTFAVLSSNSGDELLIMNGHSALKFGDDSAMTGTYVICSGSVACARAEVDGLDVPFYTAAADEALATIGISLNASSTDVGRQRRNYYGARGNQRLPDGYYWPSHCNPPHGPSNGYLSCIRSGYCCPVRKSPQLPQLPTNHDYQSRARRASDTAFDKLRAVLDFLRYAHDKIDRDDCKRALFNKPFGDPLSAAAEFNKMTISIGVFGSASIAGVQNTCGVTLHFGENGQRACTSNNALGLSQDIVGMGGAVSVTLSPEYLGGFGNVGSTSDDGLTASSVNLGYKNAGMSITFVHNLKEWGTDYAEYKVKGSGPEQAKNALVDFAGAFGTAKAIGVGFSYGHSVPAVPVPVSFSSDYIIEEQVAHCWHYGTYKGGSCRSKMDDYPVKDGDTCAALNVLKGLKKELDYAKQTDRTGMTSWVCSLTNGFLC